MFTISGKSKQIQHMFSSIAPRYDFLNRFLSFGIDTRWRQFAVKLVKYCETGRILDAATGTGDMAMDTAAVTPTSVGIVGIDFCSEMIDIAKSKIRNSPYADRINLSVAPCEAIPFPENSFDSVTIAFGIRNLADRHKGLKEMHRIIKKGGRLIILEFSTPRSPIVKTIYYFYFRRILPIVGGLFSKYAAYKYLPESVLEFPAQEDFKQILSSVGFINTYHHDLTYGIVTVYVGEK